MRVRLPSRGELQKVQARKESNQGKSKAIDKEQCAPPKHKQKQKVN
jgi:hypothetical protein